jgi:hypothetical protein
MGNDQRTGRMAAPTPIGRCLQPVTGLAARAQTGFAMYALPEDAARLRHLRPRNHAGHSVAMIRPQHLEALGALGYSLHESRFLYLAATHSGYFTLRQFLDFTSTAKGWNVHQFTSKSIRFGRIRAATCGYRTSVFNLYSRKVYAVLDRDNLRNRRRLSHELIRTRLLIRLLPWARRAGSPDSRPGLQGNRPGLHNQEMIRGPVPSLLLCGIRLSAPRADTHLCILRFRKPGPLPLHYAPSILRTFLEAAVRLLLRLRCPKHSEVPPGRTVLSEHFRGKQRGQCPIRRPLFPRPTSLGREQTEPSDPCRPRPFTLWQPALPR